MTYVMSDVHGCYEKYKQMLEIIEFTENDELYIVGDICDRGPQSAEIYLDVINRNNVYCVMGNHESMLLEALPNAFGFLKVYGYKADLDFDAWSACGGGATCASLINFDRKNIMGIYEYIKGFPYYRITNVNGNKYLLVHAGLTDYDPNKCLDDYALEDLIWYGAEPADNCYPDIYKKIIVGHTPTMLLSDKKPASIISGSGNHIFIDCGAIFEEDGGRLGCLCLDNMREFYV